ncbi:hypothetical protein C7M51_01708 [Mixta intestinalis]|jgi:hypothetical protein|uniref:Uncharacterized protein n=1 Tax=Mixta intestinalis TaxID=1615494 RepID=A0A6P1PZ21_9GAMM|nr:hypothetical protein C7M51_01708 [Mixta intestinalis]
METSCRGQPVAKKISHCFSREDFFLSFIFLSCYFHSVILSLFLIGRIPAVYTCLSTARKALKEANL